MTMSFHGYCLNLILVLSQNALRGYYPLRLPASGRVKQNPGYCQGFVLLSAKGFFFATSLNREAEGLFDRAHNEHGLDGADGIGGAKHVHDELLV